MADTELLIMNLMLLKIYCEGNKDAESVLSEAIQTIRELQSKGNEVCNWKPIDEEGYENCHYDYDETIPDFFNYCPYCGKKIKVVE